MRFERYKGAVKRTVVPSRAASPGEVLRGMCRILSVSSMTLWGAVAVKAVMGVFGKRVLSFPRLR